MALIDLFQGLPDTIFTIFASLILPGVLIIDSDDDGWANTAPVNPTYPVDVIRTSLSKEDAQKTSFYEHIQVSDVVALVKGSQVTIPLDTADALQITDRFNRTIKYHIVAFDVDAADALYILLLRAS